MAMDLKSDLIWLDGELVDFERAQVHVLTHTLHYGYGVFEGIRAYRRADGSSHVFRLAEHVARLFDSAHILALEIPYTRAELVEACVATLQANRFSEGYIRPLVFLGSEALGLGALNNRVRVAIASFHWGAYLGEDGLRNGIRAKVSSFNRSHVNVNMVKGKICGQYVNSVIAKREALKAGYDEAIMLDTQGYVSECTGENLFMVRQGTIYTAPYGSAILGGITRDTVLTLARDHGVAGRRAPVHPRRTVLRGRDLPVRHRRRDHPVREVDDRSIGSGRPGPIGTLISKAFFEVVGGRSEAPPGVAPHLRFRALTPFGTLFA
jgi:branched-chain amino acid aminotransferase